MDLKFTFGGASPDHSHGDAPSGIPLPFSTAPVSMSSVLDVHVRLAGDELVAEAISGDGVTYGRAALEASGDDASLLARSVQSAVSRVVAELDGPLAEAVTGIALSLNGREHAVIAALSFPEIDGASAVTSEAFQRRTGVTAGTPVRVA